MSPSTRLAGTIAAAAAAALLSLPGAAYARAGDLTFQQTYPRASRLCEDVAKGVGHPRLRSSAAKVLADCAKLESGFNAARASVLATRASIEGVRTSRRAATAAACAGAAKHSRACRRAHRRQALVARALLRQSIRAAHSYYATVELNRLTFWRKIRRLHGGAREREDVRIRPLDS